MSKKLVWLFVAAFVVLGVMAFEAEEASALPTMGANCAQAGCHDGVTRNAPGGGPVVKAPAAPKPAAPAPKPATPAPTAPSKAPVPANKVVTVDAKFLDKTGKVDVVVVNKDVYVSVRSAATFFGATVQYDAATKATVLKIKGYEAKGRQGHKGFSMNNKAFMLNKPIINVDGKLYIQAHSIAKISGDLLKAPMKASLAKNVLEVK
ncbi:hypothetical protein BHU72_11270 [Desulfuribacillus stibiiarsenatis]|uniref:Copper amine oxidase-like N-terminal domain-containing protein n=1 Tax=Desulfuribacillus stibiiarsenatis TaxID=1390249 RepID=A0A1E5L2T8_9FIRM|nr:stalk domain-containing protein [Desulfuribacillus stibiiarsenatis]OEH84373.1 hypothetical protein BHU72_11270 [Desulfuribacillus stibiiarsenatis]